ncbi:MAG TPA: lysophospholipid acyltransferase family protein [Gemmatimonadaceae bacterium]|jgi:1-acyl-sn-glycerol-3-phosphate acyltransferase|nr:lysophospholipid acyltransferase family protein [Gemmatimonadaceae bacterium]
MRSLWTLLVVGVTTAVLGPTVIVAALFRVRDKPHGLYQWCMHTWARLAIRAAGVKVVVHNAERATADHGVVFIGNHVSWFDVFALAATLPRYSFVAKSELRKIPVFGPAAGAAGIVYLERDNRKQAFESYKDAAAQVRDGKSIVVFPEGTRGRGYPLRPFKKGPFVLAIAAGAPIVPTIIYGARAIMPRGSFHIRPGIVHVHLLEPIPTAGMTYDQRGELMTRVWRRMADALHDLYGVPVADRPIARRDERVT